MAFAWSACFLRSYSYSFELTVIFIVLAVVLSVLSIRRPELSESLLFDYAVSNLKF